MPNCWGDEVKWDGGEGEQSKKLFRLLSAISSGLKIIFVYWIFIVWLGVATSPSSSQRETSVWCPHCQNISISIRQIFHTLMDECVCRVSSMFATPRSHVGTHLARRSTLEQNSHTNLVSFDGFCAGMLQQFIELVPIDTHTISSSAHEITWASE